MTILEILLIAILGVAAHNNQNLAHEVIDTVNPEISIEKSEDTGLTTFSAYGRSINLDVQPLDPSKLN